MMSHDYSESDNSDGAEEAYGPSYVQFLTSDHQHNVKQEAPDDTHNTPDTCKRISPGNGKRQSTEQERKARRRFTNRKAAQKSRQRERDKEKLLIEESQQEESKRTSLRYEVNKLQKLKEELQRVLQGHKCILKTFAKHDVQTGMETDSMVNHVVSVESANQPNNVAIVSRQSSAMGYADSSPSPLPDSLPFGSYFEVTTTPIQKSTSLDVSVSNDNTEAIVQPEQTINTDHSYIPLDQYKQMAQQMACGSSYPFKSEEPSLVIDTAPSANDVEPAEQGVAMNDNTPNSPMTVTETGLPGGCSSTSYFVPMYGTQSSVENQTLHTLPSTTHTHIAVEVDPKELEKQGVPGEILHMVETSSPIDQNGLQVVIGTGGQTFVGNPSESNSRMMSSLATNVQLVNDGSQDIAVSALLELNSGIVG